MADYLFNGALLSSVSNELSFLIKEKKKWKYHSELEFFN